MGWIISGNWVILQQGEEVQLWHLALQASQIFLIKTMDSKQQCEKCGAAEIISTAACWKCESTTLGKYHVLALAGAEFQSPPQTPTTTKLPLRVTTYAVFIGLFVANHDVYPCAQFPQQLRRKWKWSPSTPPPSASPGTLRLSSLLMASTRDTR